MLELLQHLVNFLWQRPPFHGGVEAQQPTGGRKGGNYWVQVPQLVNGPGEKECAQDRVLATSWAQTGTWPHQLPESGSPGSLLSGSDWT